MLSTFPVVIYGRMGCPNCHRALELLRDADVRCETVDVARCAHCLREMQARLPEGADPQPPLPQAWTGGGTYIGTLPDLERWLLTTTQHRHHHHTGAAPCRP